MFLKILLNQARHKLTVTLLLWLVMTALVCLYVYLNNSARFANRSMQLIMKSMGHNLLIIPREADALRIYTCEERQTTFDEETTRRMAGQLALKSKYYVSMLQGRVRVGDVEAVLSGAEPVHRGDETPEKPHLFAALAPGYARIGSEVARLLELAPGDTLTVSGHSFEVESVLESEGALDDLRVFVPLAAAQEILQRPGQINVIRAFLCMHGRTLPQIVAAQHQLMASLFPDFRTVVRSRIAHGRDMARRTTSAYLYYLLALVLGITVVTIAVTGVQEVTERRREVGLMLAVGGTYTYIIGLYVAKVLAIAVAAAVTGFVLGSHLSQGLLSPVLVANTRPVAVVWSQLPRILWMTCLIAVGAELLPMIKLVRMDPNRILTEE